MNRYPSRAVRGLAAVSVWLIAATPVFAQKAVFLVRHAEKVDNTSDADLSEAGRVRAAQLAKILKDAGITTIYSTDFKRTRETARPLADALHVTSTIVGREPEVVVERLRALRPTDVALVVAHSDTLPDILKRLGHKETISIADQEYDNLFIVVSRKSEPPTFLRLRY